MFIRKGRVMVKNSKELQEIYGFLGVPYGVFMFLNGATWTDLQCNPSETRATRTEPIQKPSKINPSVSSKSPQVIVVHAMQCCDHTDPPNNLLRFSVFCLLIVRHTYLLVRSTNIITTKQCDTLLNFRTVYTVQQPLCRSSILLQKKKCCDGFEALP